MTDEQKQYAFIGGAFVVGILVGLALGYLWFTAPETPELPETPANGSENADLSGNANGEDTNGADGPVTGGNLPNGSLDTNTLIKVSDQSAGSSVSVAEVDMQTTGWLVVHESTATQIGNALGAKRFAAGVHQDVTINLLRGTEAGEMYRVIMYRDNGDGEFDLETDFPLLGNDNAPIMTAFRAQ